MTAGIIGWSKSCSICHQTRRRDECLSRFVLALVHKVYIETLCIGEFETDRKEGGPWIKAWYHDVASAQRFYARKVSRKSNTAELTCNDARETRGPGLQSGGSGARSTSPAM